MANCDMRYFDKAVFLLAMFYCLLLTGCDDFKKDYQEGYAEGRKKVLNTDVGSAERPGSLDQYSSEEFRYKRSGLLGSQLMVLLPKANAQLKNIGYVKEEMKSQLSSVFDEYEVIANAENDEKGLLFVQKQRVKYSL